MPEEKTDKQKYRYLRSTMILFAALCSFGLLVFVGIQAYFYDRYPPQGAELPLIEAEKKPFKITPEDPGGMEVPHADAEVFDVVISGYEESDNKEDIPGEATETVTGEEHRTEESVTHEDITQDVEEPQHEEEDTEDQDTDDVSAIAFTQKPEAPPETDTPRSMHPEYGETPQNGKGYSVQLGSYRSISGAQEGWKMLQKRFPAEISGMKHYVKQVKLGPRGVFYRLHVGGFENENSARAFCKKMIVKKQGCLLVR